MAGCGQADTVNPMTWLLDRPLRAEPAAELEQYRSHLADRLDDTSLDRNDVVRDALAWLLHARSYADLAAAAPMTAFALDPRNVTFEAEHYAATDPVRFARVKPLLWFWRCLDGTPLGRSVASGVPLRRMLAERVFAHAGRGLKIFHDVEVSVGYNISAGDDVVLHHGVFVDDIGGVELHDGASLSDHVNVFSHTHDLLDATDVTLARTVIGRGVRVGVHAIVLAGTVLSDDSMLGAMALASRDLAPHTVGLGVPARPHGVKDRGSDASSTVLVVDASSYARKRRRMNG